jgi:hypothetical protein
LVDKWYAVVAGSLSVNVGLKSFEFDDAGDKDGLYLRVPVANCVAVKYERDGK